MGKIWLTSDLHFGHDKYFIWAPRGFNNVIEMNNTILQNMQKMISWEDDVYILGDCWLNITEEAGIQYIQQIPGKKHIIAGNHDTENRIKALQTAADIDFLGYGLPFKYGKYRFFMSHYPTLTANTDNAKIWNLSGHTHHKEKFEFLPNCIYNVALDAHNNKPVEINDIITDIQYKILERN